MKILIISSYGYVKGGTESLLSQLNPALIREGHDVRVLTSDDAIEGYHFNDLDFGSFQSHNIARRIFEKIWYPEVYIKTKKILKDFKPDIVHVHTTEQLSPSVFFALRGYPVLVSIHGPEE